MTFAAVARLWSMICVQVAASLLGNHLPGVVPAIEKNSNNSFSCSCSRTHGPEPFKGPVMEHHLRADGWHGKVELRRPRSAVGMMMKEDTDLLLGALGLL